MKTHDNRSDYFANLALVERDSWTLPSRCKRPPLKPAARLSPFARLLRFVGLNRQH